MDAVSGTVAVLVPCLDEGLTVRRVIDSVSQSLPEATVYVYDNGSTDETVAEATSAGAVVRHVPHRGKGNVVLRMLADVEADIYVMIDGDDTYDGSSASDLVATLVEANADMAVAIRQPCDGSAFPRGHYLGNRFFSRVVRILFGHGCSDLFSGYRVLSRRFVKSFAVNAAGFEIETEMTVHAIDQRVPIVEISTPYQKRPEGSTSKLRTLRDGARICRGITMLVLYRRPWMFCAAVGTLLVVAARLSGPWAVASPLWRIEGMFFLACVLLLESLAKGRREFARLIYLREPSVQGGSCADTLRQKSHFPDTRSNLGAPC